MEDDKEKMYIDEKLTFNSQKFDERQKIGS